MKTKYVICKKCGTEFVVYLDTSGNPMFKFRCPECAQYFNE